MVSFEIRRDLISVSVCTKRESASLLTGATRGKKAGTRPPKKKKKGTSKKGVKMTKRHGRAKANSNLGEKCNCLE